MRSTVLILPLQQGFHDFPCYVIWPTCHFINPVREPLMKGTAQYSQPPFTN